VLAESAGSHAQLSLNSWPAALPLVLQVSAGGVVRDPAVHRQVIDRIVAAVEEVGFACQGWLESPIKGAASGNTEFVSYFRRRASSSMLPGNMATGGPAGLEDA
jgi:23S rRNA (cytidine1920-2'-O)/16S rRNA (cytidine1409-2'-O)-methyltransferase